MSAPDLHRWIVEYLDAHPEPVSEAQLRRAAIQAGFRFDDDDLTDSGDAPPPTRQVP